MYQNNMYRKQYLLNTGTVHNNFLYKDNRRNI